MQSYCLGINETDVELSNNNYNRESQDALYVSGAYKHTRQYVIEINLDKMKNATSYDIFNGELYKTMKKIKQKSINVL
jgi:predicted N-formylglutamate amidohydrolase